MTDYDKLPSVLTPRDLQNFLPVGRDAVYRLLSSGAIRSVRSGQKYLVTLGALQDFLGGVEPSPVLGRAVLQDHLIDRTETENGQ